MMRASLFRLSPLLALALLLVALSLFHAAPAGANHTLATPAQLRAYGENEQVTLTWLDGGGTHGGGYEVEYGEDPSGALSTQTVAASAGRTATVTGLTNGTGYRFRVRAAAYSGHSASNWTGYRTARPTPGVLSGLTATSSTSASGTFTALTLSPSTFTSWTRAYSATVANTVTHVKLTPTWTSSSITTVQVGSESVTSGTASGAIALAEGANAIRARITAPLSGGGSSTETYTVTVTRDAAPPTNADLSGLEATGSDAADGTFTALTLSPSPFAAATTAYTATAAHTVTHVKLKPTLWASRATVEVGKQGETLTTVTSGTASGAIAVAEGANAITVKVTAQDGTTTKTYTLTVTRPAAPPTPPGAPNTAPNPWVPRPYVLPIEVIWQDRDYRGLPLRPYEVHYTSATAAAVADDDAAASGTDPATGWVDVKRVSPRSIHGVNGHNTYSFMRLNEAGHYRFDLLEPGTEYRIRVRAVYWELYRDIPGQWGHTSVLVGSGGAVGVLHAGWGQELTGSAFAIVRLTNPVWSHPVTVDYATADYATGTTNPVRTWETITPATAGTDYTAVSGTLTFAPGEREKWVRIPVINDNDEDSGESFQFTISNPQPANIRLGWGIPGLAHTYTGRDPITDALTHTMVTSAVVTIYNSEADLGSLTVEGAPGDQGPWSARDLGSFAAERTAYAVTVPHETTHARLTATTVSERQRMYTRVPRDGGTSNQQMLSGEAGPAFALNVGENTLFVESYHQGEWKKYTVKVTRQAPQGDVAIVNESGTRQVSLSGMFDGEALTITASSSDESVATVAVSADYSTLTVSAQGRGAATVTVTADDGKGGTVEETLTVSVKAAPVVASAIADVSGLEAGSTRNISLAGVFSDADGDALTITAVSSDDARATVSVDSDRFSLAVSGEGEGSASITVTA